MTNYLIIFILAGLLSGVVRYFTNYLKLPYYKSDSFIKQFGAKSFLKVNSFQNWEKGDWLALLGYILIAELGSFLTPVATQILNIKVFDEKQSFISNMDPWSCLILFGYALIFAYSALMILDRFVQVILANSSDKDNNRFHGGGKNSLRDENDCDDNTNLTDKILAGKITQEPKDDDNWGIIESGGKEYSFREKPKNYAGKVYFFSCEKQALNKETIPSNCKDRVAFNLHLKRKKINPSNPPKENGKIRGTTTDLPSFPDNPVTPYYYFFTDCGKIKHIRHGAAEKPSWERYYLMKDSEGEWAYGEKDKSFTWV